MKIAVITEDNVHVSQHFGRAPYYAVITVENGTVTGEEKREKASHQHFSGQEHPGHHEHPAGEAHGHDPVSQGRHAQMAAVISDCQILVCGGMGRGAYESMRASNLIPIVTDVPDIETAVKKYLEGTLVDQVERLH
jgi:predicted Fe-Mo cluster-binding NifX family protein